MPYFCTRCGAEVPALADFKLATQTCEMLLDCPRCHDLADPWTSLDRTVQAIDMILLRRAVYRHLLLNVSTGATRRAYARSTAKLLCLVATADACDFSRLGDPRPSLMAAQTCDGRTPS